MINCVSYDFLIVNNRFARNLSAQQDHSGFRYGFYK